jgi:hypothetical protein
MPTLNPFQMIGQDDQTLTSAQLLAGNTSMTILRKAQIVTVQDNPNSDVRLDDDVNSGAQVLDLNQQFTLYDYDGITAGHLIQAYGKYTAVNTTTGQTGTAILIRFVNVINPTDPTDSSAQLGQWYLAFTFDVDPGNVITLGPRDQVGGTNYVDIYICFAAGTLIATPSGPIAVEDLTTDDLVTTLDHGPQPIRWTGRRRVAATGNAAPVVFRAGAIGNDRDLMVSPQHRMLLTDWRAELMFGEPQVLVPAKALVNHDTIFVQEGGQVEYVHLLFDEHEIIFAEGVPSESFHPGATGLSTLDDPARDEVLALFPELRGIARPMARSSLSVKEATFMRAG